MKNLIRLNRTRPRDLLAVCALGMVFMTCGCAAVAVVAAGAGALSYSQGRVNKTYQAEYYQAVRASRSVLGELKIPITGQTSDALRTVIKAKRADDTPVQIQIDRDQPQLTRISVRTGVVGVTNRKASEQIHHFLGRHLNTNAFAQDATADTDNPTSANGPMAPEGRGATPRPAPAPEKEAPGKGESLPFSQNPLYIYYATDDDGLSSEANAILERVANYMQANPAVRLRVRGYTDSHGDQGYNLQISRKRALAIKSHLIAQGIKAERISAEGLGARNFIVSNKTAKLRALNRRVELELY